MIDKFAQKKRVRDLLQSQRGCIGAQIYECVNPKGNFTRMGEGLKKENYHEDGKD
jgi:hypothetical protein